MMIRMRVVFYCSVVPVSYDCITTTTLLSKTLVRMECVRTHVVSARADVVDTKIGIIPSFFLFSFHVLFSQKGFAYDFEFLHTFLSNKNKYEWTRKLRWIMLCDSNNKYKQATVECNYLDLFLLGFYYLCIKLYTLLQFAQCKTLWCRTGLYSAWYNSACYHILPGLTLL